MSRPAERSFGKFFNPVTDVSANAIDLLLRMTELLQSVVYRSGNVGDRIDQRSVKIV